MRYRQLRHSQTNKDIAMKTLTLAFYLACSSMLAQQQGAENTSISATNQSATSNAVFSSSTGQSYTAEQLAEQLKNLRAAVEQTMPALNAFTETYSNTTSANKPISGKLGDILSGALNRNSAASSTSPTVSNVVGVLRGYLSNTNASNSSSALDANTVSQLVKLQNDLRPILPILDQLNVQSASSTIQPSRQVLSPTGR
jgi:hypothetical protein